METTAVVKFISTKKAKLVNLEVKDGQLIFCEDSRELYLDHHGVRTQYGSFIFLNTEEQRLLLPSPLTSFYFVYETNLIWRYDGASGWIQITSPPQEQIQFMDFENFPEEGNSKAIYISGSDIYRWNDGEYQSIGGSYWKNLV